MPPEAVTEVADDTTAENAPESGGAPASTGDGQGESAAAGEGSSDEGSQVPDSLLGDPNAGDDASSTDSESGDYTPPDVSSYEIPEDHPLLTEHPDFLDSLAEKVSKGKLTDEQARAELDWQMGLSQGRRDAFAARATEWVSEIKDEWGDQFDAKLGSGKRALAEFGDAELSRTLADTGLGNYPPFLRFCAKAGAAVASERKGLVSGDTPAGADPGWNENFPNSGKDPSVLG